MPQQSIIPGFIYPSNPPPPPKKKKRRKKRNQARIGDAGVEEKLNLPSELFEREAVYWPNRIKACKSMADVFLFSATRLWFAAVFASFSFFLSFFLSFFSFLSLPLLLCVCKIISVILLCLWALDRCLFFYVLSYCV